MCDSYSKQHQWISHWILIITWGSGARCHPFNCTRVPSFLSCRQLLTDSLCCPGGSPEAGTAQPFPALMNFTARMKEVWSGWSSWSDVVPEAPLYHRHSFCVQFALSQELKICNDYRGSFSASSSFPVPSPPSLFKRQITDQTELAVDPGHGNVMATIIRTRETAFILNRPGVGTGSPMALCTQSRQGRALPNIGEKNQIRMAS